LEDILRQIPRGLHDWNKFIKPDELVSIMQASGFSNFEIQGFDVTHGMNFEVLKDVILKGLKTQNKDEKMNLFKIQLNQDTSMCYIGKAKKI